ncbi:hypothetical protein [Thermotalea metallivorans]|uniref:Uncharacterized protein n=1 Tax=Thermotalea metallivorans TaxID=520762 RepID=A0A140L403_9FIRM|nr:hypothetical protein [Thermotalea metallivorans]KXG75278.1 hypothetical protein AN619_18430 [Thermotalea metallivorans]
MRRKRTVAFLLIFILCINIFSGFINPKQPVYANTPSPYRYRLVVAYFEYWKQADGVFKWQDSQGVVHTIGTGNPNSYLVSNYTFPVALMSGNYEIEKIMNYNQYTGSWEDLNYTGGLREDEIRKFYMDSAVITNSNALIGEKNTTVSFTASFYPLSTDDAKKMSETVYRSYIAIVIKYVDSAYKEDPIQWEIDHGIRTDNITASLTGSRPLL